MAIVAVRNIKRTMNATVLTAKTVVANELAALDGATSKLTNLATGASAQKAHCVVMQAGVAGDVVSYIPLDPEVELLMDADAAVGAGNVGKNYGLTITSQKPIIAVSDTTNVVVHVVELAPSTTQAWVRIIPAYNTFTTLAAT